MSPAIPVDLRRIVLVVDDAEGCVATLDLILQTMPGVEVRSEPSAEAALALLERDTVSAVITDIHLPEMTGLELISRIRENPRFQGLPILVVSADPDPLTPGRARERGANAYFTKPFSPSAMRKKLEELIYAS